MVQNFVLLKVYSIQLYSTQPQTHSESPPSAPPENIFDHFFKPEASEITLQNLPLALSTTVASVVARSIIMAGNTIICVVAITLRYKHCDFPRKVTID